MLITGLHTNICDRHTAADAFFRGFDIAIVTDGVDAFTQEDHEQGLAYFAKVYGAKLMTTREVLSEWGVQSAQPQGVAV